MKTADLRALEPGTELAVTSFVRRAPLGTLNPVRVVLLGLEPEGEPIPEPKPNQWNSRRSEYRKRTVHVRFIDSGRESYFQPRNVLATWAQYEQAKAEYDRQMRERIAERTAIAARKEADAAAMKELLTDLGLTEVSVGGRYGASTASVTLTRAQLEALVAEAADRALRGIARLS